MTLRQRQPRVRNEAFLAFVRQHACISCFAPAPSQAAHLRAACPERDKRGTGKAEKPSDRWAVPLCRMCHLDGPHALHRTSEAAFFARLGVDPFACAARLYASFYAQPHLREKIERAANRKPRRRIKTGFKPGYKSRKIPARKNPWPKGRKIANRRKTR